MDVHASPTTLPELEDFLSTFNLHFRRSEGEAALERYLTGLLTELPNKNCDTMATAVPGTSEQRLQEFLTNMQWDEEDLNRQRVEKLIAEATFGNGMLIFDDTGFGKQGKASVGVGRVSRAARWATWPPSGERDLWRQRCASPLAASRALVLASSMDRRPRGLEVCSRTE